MIYIVREQTAQQNQDPTVKGTELARFKTWEEAREYSDTLWWENKINSYVSISESEE